MPANAREPRPLRLSAFWFGIQCVWGAVLAISLQARCVALAGPASVLQYGHISIAGAIAAAIAQLLVGPYSDVRRRAGDRRIGFYIAGALGGAVAIVAFYRAGSIIELGIAFVALQLAMNVAIGPYQAILPDVVAPARIGNASGAMAASQSAGNAAGAILASLVLQPDALGVTLALVLVAACAITTTHLRALALRPPAAPAPLLISRTFVDLFISRAFVYVGFYTLLGYLYFYVRNALPHDSPFSASTASGVCVLLFTVVGAFGAVIAARPADRGDERIILTLGGGVLAAAILSLAAITAWPAIPVAIALAGAGWGVFLCADWAFACRLLPAGALATSMAIWNLAVVAPQMLAPLGATLLLARAGLLASPQGPHVVFALAALEILIGITWIWRLPGSRAGDNA